MSDFTTHLAELNRLGFIMPEARGMIANSLLASDALAQDAQPALSTTASGGIPAFMSAWSIRPLSRSPSPPCARRNCWARSVRGTG